MMITLAMAAIEEHGEAGNQRRTRLASEDQPREPAVDELEEGGAEEGGARDGEDPGVDDAARNAPADAEDGG